MVYHYCYHDKKCVSTSTGCSSTDSSSSSRHIHIQIQTGQQQQQRLTLQQFCDACQEINLLNLQTDSQDSQHTSDHGIEILNQWMEQMFNISAGSSTDSMTDMDALAKAIQVCEDTESEWHENDRNEVSCDNRSNVKSNNCATVHPCPWVQTCMAQVLRLLLQTLQSGNDISPSTSSTLLYHHDIRLTTLVRSIWWWDQLHISSISCSPLAVTTQSIGKYPELYKDVILLQIVDNDAAATTEIGIDVLAVLVTLLQQYKDNIQCTPPAMLLRSISSERNGALIMMMGEIPCNSTNNKKTMDVSTVESVNNTSGCTSLFSDTTKWTISQDLTLLETNIDDMTAEHLSFALEILIQRTGVVDTWSTPILMKKGRPAHTLHCLCTNPNVEDVLYCIFEHTTTLGVRVQSYASGMSRVALPRKMISVQVELQIGSDDDAITTTRQTVECKIGYLGSKIATVKAEYDQCKAISMQFGLPLRYICDCVVQKARSILDEENKKVN